MLFREYIQNKSHIIWDWNGTILDDVDHAVTTINILLEKRDMKLLGREAYRRQFKFPILDYYQDLGFDLKRESFKDLCDEFVGHYLEGLDTCTAFETTRQRLEQVKALNIKQSILSAADQDSLDHMVGHFQMGAYFENIYGIKDKMGFSKVGRGRELLQASGVGSQDTLILGDTLHDLEVAQSLGCDMVLVAHGHQEASRLKRAHHMVLEGL